MTRLKGNSLQYLNIVYRFTILYFVLIVAKFKLFPSIINSYFEFEIQLINDLGIDYKIALFSVFCGFAHTTLRYLIQNILIKKIYIYILKYSSIIKKNKIISSITT